MSTIFVMMRKWCAKKGAAVPRKSKTKAKLTGYCDSKELAELFGFDGVRRVQQLTQDGVLETFETSEGRRYDAKTNIKKYISYLSGKAYGREKSRDEEALKLQKLEMEVAWKESQTELQNLKAGILNGKYIPVDEVQSQYVRLFSDFKKFAVSIPGKLLKKIGSKITLDEKKELDAALKREVAEMLQGYALNAEVGGNEEKEAHSD